MFLGKPVGLQLVNDHSKVKEFYDKAVTILRSALTPWQKLDAMKSFFFPSLQYAQHIHQLSKTDWIELDVAIRNLVKKDVLYLPPRAATIHIYMGALLTHYWEFPYQRRTQKLPSLMEHLKYLPLQTKL